MFSQELHDRRVIAIGGDDRIAFLQGLITNDAAALSEGAALYAAMLSPQGKFLHDFFLIPQGGQILLDVNKDRADDLLARLKLYKLRSKVTLAVQENMKAAAFWGDGDAPVGAIADPRFTPMGGRFYGEAIPAATSGDYEAHRISLGVPDGAKDMHIDKSLLLEFGFEALHGVSFSKGCYVGQEVTARSKFRGAVRKRLYVVRGNAALPAMGSPVISGTVNLGELRSVSGTVGLALLRSEELEKMEAPLTSEGVSLQYHLPEWNQ